MNRFAFISVTNKTGIAELAQCFVQYGIQIISSGGTYNALKEAGIRATEVSVYTGEPELYHGRVKTLHPKVQGGMLFVRNDKGDCDDALHHGHNPIDFVVCNLYEFEKAVSSPHITLGQAIEKIDIGGPTNIRAAAKNYESVTVLCDPADYPEFLKEMHKGVGTTTEEFRLYLAAKVFQRMAEYETAIIEYLNQQPGVHWVRPLV